MSKNDNRYLLSGPYRTLSMAETDMKEMTASNWIGPDDNAQIERMAGAQVTPWIITAQPRLAKNHYAMVDFLFAAGCGLFGAAIVLAALLAVHFHQ